VQQLAVYIALRFAISKSSSPYDKLATDTELVEFIKSSVKAHLQFKPWDDSEQSKKLSLLNEFC
jgi:hypothetical protein